MTKTIDTKTGMTLSLIPETEEQDIVQNVYCIIKTVLGSVPLLRDYGLANNFLHLPITSARSAYAAAVADAIARYEPRARVENVDFDSVSDEPGHLYPIVEVTIGE